MSVKHQVPQYLFRIFTNQSNGTSSKYLLEPAANANRLFSDYIPQEYQEATTKKQLLSALSGNSAEKNPYIFTTSTFLYAIQHAIHKTYGKGETNTQILCIDTETCRTPCGEEIRFASAVELMRDLNVPPPRSKWTHKTRDYSDVYITSDTIVVGEGSHVVTFKTLETAGLYHLYPELEIINRRKNPGLEQPVSDLREIWFEEEVNLSQDAITLASQLASTFEPVRGNYLGASETVPMHLLAWLLAAKAQRPDGKGLKQWLLSFAHARFSDHSGSPVLSSGIPEVDQFNLILRLIGGCEVWIREVEEVNVYIRQDWAESHRSTRAGRKRSVS